MRMNIIGSRQFAMAISVVMLLLGAALRGEDVQQQEEEAFKAAVATIAPSVVRIETFGGQEKVGNVLIGSGPTTGLIVSEDGFILSSAFNFIQKPSSILVTLPTGKRVAAQTVARDHSRMLVLLKVTTDDKLPVAAVVPREELQVGQWALAIGRTYEQADPNVSIGVVSAKDRIWGKAMQCDAKISPNNYGGPLIDIRGRVLGVLVPMSPTAQGEVAGAEWYDSGIGFAVPLVDLLPRLEKLKAGTDLYPGLLGISLKGTDIYADPASLVACQPNGPAAKAGLKAQDTIIEIDGQSIVRQAQLKHALGVKYAGDTVHVVVLRGEEKLPFDIELTDELAAYQHPFVGILPQRIAPQDGGVVVRYVYPSSPAAEGGLAIGDRIMALDGKEIKDYAGLAEALAACEMGKQISLTYRRGEDNLQAQVTPGAQPTTIPTELPPAHGDLPAAPERPPVGVVEIKIPEEKNDCVAYVPNAYHPDVPHGVLLVLCEQGGFDRDKLVARYQAICDKHDVILVLARSADPAKWDMADAAFVRKAVEDVIAHYNVDRARIAALGYQTSGTMAYVTAFSHPDLIRAVAAIEAVPPSRGKPPENEPSRRWSIYIAMATRSPQKSGIDAAIKRLQEMKFPVVVKSTGQTARDLNEEELAEVGRWLDSLDRL